jgi:hypothetical protein
MSWCFRPDLKKPKKNISAWAQGQEIVFKTMLEKQIDFVNTRSFDDCLLARRICTELSLLGSAK